MNKYVQQVGLTLATAMLVAACGGTSAVRPTDLAAMDGRISPEDLYIVDCLLPGQVRQLGTGFTYLSARRPIRTTAQDCAIRGGEYVAYDRANYATALKVWLPRAQEGDAEAQVIVGEVYEQGLGVEADFETAAMWFKRAADQGNSRAQINLGSLYERGAGVPQDMTQAMNWYRAASGITEGTLERTTEEEIRRRRALEVEAQTLRTRVLQLREALRDTRQLLDDRRAERDRVSLELQAMRAAASRTAARSDAERAQAQAQLATLNQRNTELSQRLQQAQRASTGRSLQASETREAVAQARRRLARAELELESQSAELAAARVQLDDMRKRLLAANSAVASARLRSEIERAENQFAERQLVVARTTGDEEALLAARAALTASSRKQSELEEALAQQSLSVQALKAQLNNTRDELATAQAATVNAEQAQLQIAALEAEMQSKDREIARYEAQTRELMSDMGVAGPVAVAAQTDEPVIRVISPQVGLTRGLSGVTVYSDVDRYEVIGQVTPLAELISFRVNDMDVRSAIDENGLFQVEIPLASTGDTAVRIEAVNRDGTRTENSFLIAQEAPEPIAVRQASQILGKRLKSDLGSYHALVIGNNDYRDFPQLQTASNDATAVADVLRDAYGYNVRLLTNATQEQILFEFARLTQELKAADNLLVYYAGHGVLDGGGEAGYWIPTDAGRDDREAWISNEAITDFLSAMEAKHVLVVADSCYSGTLSGSTIRPIPLEIDDDDLIFISRVKARTVMKSGGLQPVLDQGGGQHSIFAEAFLDALRDNRSVLEGYRLYQLVERGVTNRSRLAGVTQRPRYTALKHAGHECSEFFFMPEQLVAERFVDRASLFAAR